MDSKQVLMLLAVAVFAVTCLPCGKDEHSIRKNPSIGIVHIRFISDAGVDELLGIFNPEALQRSLDKLPEELPSAVRDKPIENPLDKKKSEPNVEHLPMEKDEKGNPMHVIEEKEREKNPIHMPEQKEKEPFLENPVHLPEKKEKEPFLENPVHLPEQKEREPLLENPVHLPEQKESEPSKENVLPERERIRRRREVRKDPLQTELHGHESPDKLQEQKGGKDFKKEESHHEIPVANPLESKRGESENINPEKPKLGSEKLNPDEPKVGKENVNLEKPKLGSEKEHLKKPELDSKRENPEERKERPDVSKEPEEQHEKERSEESPKESEEERKSESFPSILLPPKVMSKRRRSVFDSLPVSDVGMYDERSHYRLPGTTDIQVSEDRPHYGMSGTHGAMHRYRVDDPYGDARYGRLGVDRPIYDDRYGPYGTDTLVDIQMK